jgi:hypothetical protein
MSNHSPTDKQLAYLRVLAHKTGTTFVTPRDRRQASSEIKRLRSLERRNGRYVEPRRNGTGMAYGSAPHSSEIEGWGASARWRTSKPREIRQPAARLQPEPEGASSDLAATRPAERLARYLDDATGFQRELVSISVPDGTLVLDRAADAHEDARLVGRLAADEPGQNAQLLAALYLKDPGRGRCRRLISVDLQAVPREPPIVGAGVVRWDVPLVAGSGVIFQLQAVSSDVGCAVVGWTKTGATNGGGLADRASLRHVVGELQAYEPALSMTAAAIGVHEHQHACSVCGLRGELKRVVESPIVLNRRLRERVEHAVAHGLTMSEIAMRCGRVKRDPRGNESGETSWLARRIGQAPEAGRDRPTPWVHSDVLALIARDGLGMAPRDVEL